MADNRLYKYKGEVVKVVDGDTIDVMVDLGFNIFIKERFRLARIDAWEVRGEERVKGLEAKAFVKDLLDGKEVFIDSQGTGKYGRWIAEVFVLDDKGAMMNVNDELMEKGHAKPVEW